MISRRSFLAGAIGALALGEIPRAAAVVPTLRLGFLRSASVAEAPARDTADGIALGMSEGLRAARLLGRDLVLATGLLRSGDSIGHALKDLQAGVVLALLNEEECLAASQAAEEAHVLLLNLGSRSDALRGEHCGRYTFHVEAGAATYRAAVARASRPGSEPALWSSGLERFGAGQLNDRYRHAAGRPMTSPAWAGWFAVKAMEETAERSGAQDSSSLLAHLERLTTGFDGHKGELLSFRPWDHQLRQPLYLVSPDASTASGPRAIQQVPSSDALDDGSPREVLDSLYGDPSDTRCHWTPS